MTDKKSGLLTEGMVNNHGGTPHIRLSHFFLIIAIFLEILLSAGCTSPAGQAKISGLSSPVEKVDIYHFHPTNGCKSCTTVGEFAEATVKEYYPDEIKNKKLVFDHINFQDSANAELVKQYEVIGSSLMIGVYNSTGFYKESVHKAWYMTGNKTQYMNYLKGVIDLRLAGDLS